jgi:hypothetical protein
MSIVSPRAARGSRVPSWAVVSAVLAASLFGAGAAGAQIQTSAQQKCLTSLYGAAGKVGKAQGKLDSKCVKARQAFATEQLGNEDQVQTVDACPTNDPKGAVAKTAVAVANTEIDRCTAEPPSFGAANADRIAGAASSQARAMLRDLFGPNLHWTILGKATHPDKAGVACQPTIVKNVGALYDTLWKSLGKAAKGALAGKTGPAVTTSGELETAVLTALAADTKITKTPTKLTDSVAATCGATTQQLIDMFRGRCMPTASTTAAQLGACAVSSTRCHFCRAITSSAGLSPDCDAFDDGVANDSCVGFASAHEITDSGELITGPLAHGRLGDTMLENGVARYIIQKPNVRDMYSVGAFGGNIIDVELVGHPGMDNFLEIQPAINIETVINATSLEVVNDGTDGGAAGGRPRGAGAGVA